MKVMIMIKYTRIEIKKKLKINNTLIEKYKELLKNPDFEQNCYSRTATGIFEIGYDAIRLMKWICYYDRSYYENINYFDLMASILKGLKNDI